MRGLLFLGAEDHRMDIAAWLRGLGLEQYAAAFRDNDVDGEVLPELTAEDLISIGVTSVGHRRKLLSAIAALGAAASAPALTATPASVPPPAPVPAQAERRQLTVMFCDLVGSTELATRLDPEDLRDIIAVYHGRVTEIVTRYGGFAARLMGDGVLAYFGYPLALRMRPSAPCAAVLRSSRRSPGSAYPSRCKCALASPPVSSWSAI